MKKLLILIFTLPLFSYSQESENLPFATDDFKSVRPLSKNKYEIGFRLFASNAKSLDRVITLTKYQIKPLYEGDTSGIGIEYYGEIKYIGVIKQNEFLKTDEINLNRVKDLIETLQKIDFENYKTDDTIISGIHDPNSTYTIEWVRNGEKNTFTFHTEYPRDRTRQREFEKLEDLFFKIFPELKENK